MFRIYEGVVEDINDPLDANRVRVRVYGIHTPDKSLIPTAALPWALVSMPCTSASVSGIGNTPHGLLQGSTVTGYFRDSDLQQFVVTGTLVGIPEAPVKPSDGFSDPDGAYPYLFNESDVNRLARGEKLSETIVQKKRDSRVTGVQDARGSTWDEPATEYAAKYPKNKVMETESGHIVEYDDTPGAERIVIHHRSGTFEEFYPDGKKVDRRQSDSFEIDLSNRFVLVNGDMNTVVAGNYRLNVGGEAYVKAKNLIFDVKKTQFYGISEAQDHISSNISGAFHQHISSIPGNLNSVPVGYVPSLFPTPAGNFSFGKDDTDWTPDRIQEGIDKGYFTKEEITKKPVETRKDQTPAEKQEPEIPTCDLVDPDDIDYYQPLSDNFVLRDVSLGAVVSQYEIQAQAGLTEEEIVCNLKNIVNNAAEKILAQYSDMIITSGFRQGTGTSQHEFGEAIDLQFPDHDPEDYFDIATWIKDNVAFDQLLLEYKSYGSKLPWIHISLKREKADNRYQILTLFNNATHDQGLVDLSTT